MSKGIYFILHYALIAAMAITAVAVCLNGKESKLPEEHHAEVETTAFVSVETEAKAIPVFDTNETQAEETAAPKSQGVYLGEFKLTAYCGENYPHICNDGDSTHTATMTQPTAGRTIAVDPKVIPYGSKVLINGITYIAEDCGGAIKGKRIDVYHDTHAEALEFGVQYADVTIIK